MRLVRVARLHLPHLSVHTQRDARDDLTDNTTGDAEFISRIEHAVAKAIHLLDIANNGRKFVYIAEVHPELDALEEPEAALMCQRAWRARKAGAATAAVSELE